MLKAVLYIVVICAFTGGGSHSSPLEFYEIKSTCSNCRAVTDYFKLNHKVHIKKNSLGYARLRSNATGFSPENKTNLIDSIPHDTWLYAMGPVKNADFSDGIAYIIRIKDTEGKFYMGYLSFTVFDTIEPILTKK